MAIVRCSNRHFYDDTKFRECPHCKGALGRTPPIPTPDALHNDMTVSVRRKVEYAPSPAQPSGPDRSLDATVSVLNRGQNRAQTAMPVGWLVCIEGPERGRFYTLLAGRNFAGRALDADISLSGDGQVSEKGQFSIVFDPMTAQFSLVPGSGGVTYLNDQLLSHFARIQDWDRIRVGETTLVLRTFCGEMFQWNRAENTSNSGQT